MNGAIFCCIFLVTLTFKYGISSPVTKNDDPNIVWFPDPSVTTGEDKYIPGYLTPQPADKQNSKDITKIRYFLYTKENPNEPDELFVGDIESLKNSHLQPNAKLKLMSHGIGGEISHPFPWDSKNELLLLESENNNIILVDWSDLAESPDYVGAAQNARVVAQRNAEMLQFLLEQEACQLEDIHFIGYSLGGQSGGITGYRFTQLSGLKLPRLTGLDPAKPLFEDVDDSERISPDDADFVDIIHTSAGLLGIINPRGSVDFYPNDGTRQPGCGVDIVGSCAHSRGPAFFKESILGSVPFRSCKCIDWDEYDSGNCSCEETVSMGYWINQSTRGKFYLRTSSEEPFALG